MKHTANCITSQLCKVHYSIVLLQVEEYQEAEEIDCDELLVGDEDGADYHDNNATNMPEEEDQLGNKAT